jgi:hypothetical protein
MRQVAFGAKPALKPQCNPEECSFNGDDEKENCIVNIECLASADREAWSHYVFGHDVQGNE